MSNTTLRATLGQARSHATDREDQRYDNLNELIADQVVCLLEGIAASEVEQQVGAAPYERGPERQDQRNGSRCRQVQLPFTTIEIKVPRLRAKGYVPSFLEPGHRAVKDVEEYVRNGFLSGLCRSDIIRLMQSTTGMQPSNGVLHRVQKELDAAAKAFKTRAITDTYEYLFLDAAWVKDIAGGQSVRVCVMVALGITASGERHLLGYERSSRETEGTWRGFLTRLVERGLNRNVLQLVISDEHAGLTNAITEVFGDVARQLCWAHRMRNVYKAVNKEDSRAIVRDLRAIYAARDLRQAKIRLGFLYRRWVPKYPQLMLRLRVDMPQLLAFYACPAAHWEYLRTSNPIERVFVEVRRRRYGCGALANSLACDRLFYNVFERLNRHWAGKDIWYIRTTRLARRLSATNAGGA